MEEWKESSAGVFKYLVSVLAVGIFLISQHVANLRCAAGQDILILRSLRHSKNVHCPKRT